MLELPEEQRHLFGVVHSGEEVLKYGQALVDYASEADDGTTCAWTATVGDTVIGCGGIVTSRPNVGEAWTLLSDEFRKYAHRCAPEIKRQAAQSTHLRVFALIDVGFERAERFIQWIGFEHEGTLKRSGTNGQDQEIYARIKEG